MVSKKQSIPISRRDKIKRFFFNLLIKTLLYMVGAGLVLILFVSAIPSLIIILLIGNFSFEKGVNEECGLPVNHFND